MAKLTKREFVLLIILFAAICVAAYYNFVIKPFQAKDEDLSIQISDADTKLADMKNKQTTIKLVEGKIAVIKEELGAEYDRVLDSIDNPAIIVMLSKTLPPEATATTYTFSPAYLDLEDNYITTVTVDFTCSQAGYLQVLTDLRNADYVNRIVNATLVINTADTQENNCQASIQIEIITKSVTPTNTEFTYS